jgi:hypothetical protein
MIQHIGNRANLDSHDSGGRGTHLLFEKNVMKFLKLEKIFEIDCQF